jgi:hypothetical protein
MARGLTLDFGPGNYGIVWQYAPAPHDPSIINFDILWHPVFARVHHGMWESKLPVMFEMIDLAFLYCGAIKEDITHPHSFTMEPIYPPFDEEESHRDSFWGFSLHPM